MITNSKYAKNFLHLMYLSGSDSYKKNFRANSAAAEAKSYDVLQSIRLMKFLFTRRILKFI